MADPTAGGPRLGTGWPSRVRRQNTRRFAATAHHSSYIKLAVRSANTSNDLAIAERIFVEGYPVEEGAGQPGATLPSSLADTNVTVRIAAVDGVDVAVGMSHVAHGCVNLCRGGDSVSGANHRRLGSTRARPSRGRTRPPSSGLHQRLLTTRLRTSRLRQRHALHHVGPNNHPVTAT